tara:strand:- start:1034 stop:1171 length:138 start_codon:yes stop_codon:yes gene_type:complete
LELEPPREDRDDGIILDEDERSLPSLAPLPLNALKGVELDFVSSG